MSTPDRYDLAEGLPAETLAPGEMIEGTYEGARVLLARVGDDFFAVGGECTHYGAPLCEGLLRGTTVLCPWHHARFDVVSGRATSPPALSALQRYRVSVEGGRVRVLGPVASPRESRQPARHPDSVVIVGAGAAGAFQPGVERALAGEFVAAVVFELADLAEAHGDHAGGDAALHEVLGGEVGAGETRTERVVGGEHQGGFEVGHAFSFLSFRGVGFKVKGCVSR